jgi:hypothetical protein
MTPAAGTRAGEEKEEMIGIVKLVAGGSSTCEEEQELRWRAEGCLGHLSRGGLLLFTGGGGSLFIRRAKAGGRRG